MPRLVDPLIAELLCSFPAVMLLGARATGKTTTARQHATNVTRLDVPDDAGAFRADPDATLRAMSPAAGTLLIDEWQEVPEVLGAVKRAVDADRTPGRFLLTGSVRARLTSATWPGTGRVITVDMFGMTVAERQPSPGSTAASDVLTRISTGVVDDLRLPPSLPDLPVYLELALTGGYPEAVFSAPRDRRRWLASYIDDLMTRDAPDLAQVRNPALMRAFFQAVALNTAGIPTQTSLARAVDIDVRTAKSYEQLLDDLRVITHVPAWHHRRLTRLIKTAKRYVLDSGLAAAAIGVDFDAVMRSTDLRGRFLETFVATQLLPLLSVHDDAPRLFHLRQLDGRREVDLVVELANGSIIAIEVKAASHATSSDTRHLIWLRDQLGDQFLVGLVLYTGRHVVQLHDRILAAPIAVLWG